MEAPDNTAGRWTEEIMADWRRRLELRKEPMPNTASYNAAYEAVYSVLSRRMP